VAYPIKSLPTRAAERALKVLAGSWKPMILKHLIDGPKRLSELKRLLPKASQKVLIQQLREMEEHGIARRQLFAQVPMRVEYSATELGKSLEPLLASLCEWGRRHAAELDQLDQLEACTAEPAEPLKPTGPRG
jgi:DNA-binding HxlR family transcriptional regulator